MEAGFAIAEQWLNQGAIVQRRSRKGIETGHASARGVTDKPMVVLVNQGTSGAGEILIGALQDNGDALVVGQTTLGSGLIQTTRTLADDTAILVTIGDYLTPSGRSLRTIYVQPVVAAAAAAALTLNELSSLTVDDLGTTKDRVYKAAELTLLERIRP